MKIIGVSFVLAGLLAIQTVAAQIPERVFKSDHRIDPDKKGQLSVELDNISFFKEIGRAHV